MKRREPENECRGMVLQKGKKGKKGGKGPLWRDIFAVKSERHAH